MFLWTPLGAGSSPRPTSLIALILFSPVLWLTGGKGQDEEHPAAFWKEWTEIWVKLNLVDKIWGHFTKAGLTSQTFWCPTTAGALKNERAPKEGAICRDALSLAAEVGRDIGREWLKWWWEGIHAVTVLKYRWVAHWVLAPLLPWRYQTHLRTYFILQFSLFQWVPWKEVR